MTITGNQGLLDNLHAMTDSYRAAEAAGAGRAYQAVAQASAMAIQDATDSLRNMNTVTTVALGSVLARLVETGKPEHLEALAAVQRIATEAAETFKAVGVNASMVLTLFPSGADATEPK